MASLVLGAPPMASHSRHLSSNLSFSRTETLGFSLSTSSSLAIPTTSATLQTLPLVYCGRGDRKTAKGKRFNHSFGNARPRNKRKGRGPPRAPVPPSAPKKDPFDNDEVVKIEIDESLFSN